VKNKQVIPWQFIILVFSVSYIYAIVRYHFFGNAPLKDFPLYITNKALAISSVVFFVSYLVNKKKSYLGGISYILVLGHILISLLILSPVYFKKFYSNDFELNGLGNLSLLAGILSFLALWIYHQIKKGNTFYAVFQIKHIRNFILITLGLHLLFMGYHEWFNPLTWKGYLPPISLVAMFFVLFGIFKK